MKVIYLCVSLCAVLSLSCKKSKDAAPPAPEQPVAVAPAVYKTSTTLFYLPGQQNLGSVNWFNVDSMQAYHFSEIKANPALQPGIAFGYYSNDAFYALYRIPSFPKISYGESMWPGGSGTVFRKTTVTKDNLTKMEQTNAGQLPSLIENAYTTGEGFEFGIKGFKAGQAFVFSTKGDKVKGILIINMVDEDWKAVGMDVWVLK